MATSYPEDKAADLALAKVATLDEKYSLEDGSGIIQGSEGVTEQEFKTLRHVSDRLPWTAWLVVVVEFAERWTYYGTTNIYNNYIKFPLPEGSRDGSVPFGDREEGVAGALGQGVQKSFAIRTFNTFLVYIMPLFGAVIADLWLGRYKTILLFTCVLLVGHIILVASASPASLEHPDTAMGLLVFSIVVMGIGAGSIKSNVSPLVAEQYTGKLRKETLKSGEVVIKSPAVTIQTIYLWFYFAINVGSLCAISASFLARDKGYWVAFLVPTIVICLIPSILVIGRKHYVVTPPRGSVLLDTIRVVTMCLAPCWSINPIKTIKTIRRTTTFWDTAKPSSYTNETRPKRIVWDDEFVGEVERTLKACAVFLFFPFYWLCYSQIDGNLGTVAGGMTLKGTPNDLIQNLNPITLIVFIPIFDYFIYPFLRRRGINFTPIKRIYAGFLVAGLAMVWAAVLEKYLYDTSPCPDHRPSDCVDAEKKPLHSPLNVWIVSGPYILVGISEIFASITSLEYAFTKAPKRMKSVVMAISQIQNAFSAAINFALVAVNVEDKFMWLFASFAITAWVIGTIFFTVFRSLDRREAELNQIGTGERDGFNDESSSITKVAS